MLDEACRVSASGHRARLAWKTGQLKEETWPHGLQSLRSTESSGMAEEHTERLCFH